MRSYSPMGHLPSRRSRAPLPASVRRRYRSALCDAHDGSVERLSAKVAVEGCVAERSDEEDVSVRIGLPVTLVWCIEGHADDPDVAATSRTAAEEPTMELEYS